MTSRLTATLASLLAVTALALGACSASDDTSPDAEDQDPTASDEAELTAKKCGGIAGLHCPSGYSCVITAHHPDAMGTCKKKKPSCATMTCPKGQHCMVMGTPGAPMCM